MTKQTPLQFVCENGVFYVIQGNRTIGEIHQHDFDIYPHEDEIDNVKLTKADLVAIAEKL